MSELLKTPLFDLHEKLGAKMVPFAGYAMPVQYPAGVLKEHLATRESAGLFDVSHMGQIRAHGPNLAEALESLLPQDVLGLEVNRQRYGLLTNADGGIRDDLMFANCGDHFMLVVNAACKHDDFGWLRQGLPASIDLELLENKALLAVQGPRARQAMSRLAPALAELRFMDTTNIEIQGIPCWVSCSGYTGEDGFELSVAAERATALAELLLACPEIAAIGLGARDSLRLEAGLCLYGHDIDTDTTPVSANLKWAVSPVRRPGGKREGGYPGADIVAATWQQGSARKRVLLDIEGRAPVREGVQLVTGQGEVCGRVTSGGFGPSVGKPVAMAYVDTPVVESGATLFAEVRKNRIPVNVRTQPFVEQRYYRG